MHRDFLPCIDAHCQCTRFLFLLAKEVQDQRRSWECQTKFWCIVPSFKTLSSLRFRIISEFSWKHWSVGQSCVLPLSYQGFSWWQRLTQWAKKKGVTDVSQAHNQSKPRQWAEIQVGGTRALSRLQYFFDTCPLLCKFVQDCVKDPEHNLEYLMLSCPNWNLRVHHDRNTCVNALRSLSGSKPFLMIEWGTPWNTPGRAWITIFGRQTADYSHSAIISRACLRSIERCYWGDKEAQLKIQVLKFNLH